MIEKLEIEIDDNNLFVENNNIHDFTPVKNPLFINSINDSVDVLEPVKNGKEFIIKRAGIILKNFTKHFINDDIVGRYFGDIYPKLKEVYYPHYKEIYDTKIPKEFNIKVLFNENIHIIHQKIVYENGELLIISKNNPYSDDNDIYEEATNLSDNYLNENYIIVYNVKENKYSWSKRLYELLEIEPKEEDAYRNILIEHIVEGDVDIIKENLSKLTPNNPEVEYTFRVSTKSNNIKFLTCAAFAVFDRNHTLRMLIYFFKDMTIDKITYDNLNLLEENLEILEDISNSAILYKDASGKYCWTSNIYNIIECDDCEDEKECMTCSKDSIELYTLVTDLVIDEDKHLLKKFRGILTVNNPSAVLKLRITTKKGNLKYLELILRDNFDDDGNVVSRNMFVYDITDVENIMTDNSNILNAFNSVDYNLKTGIIFEDSQGDLRVSKMFKDIVGIYIGWPDGGRELFIKNLINQKFFSDQYNKFLNNEVDELNITVYYKYDGKEDQIKVLEYYVQRIDDKVSGYLRDITQTKENQIKLKTLNTQKSLLIKEIHHRVKNNLQVLSSLLNLEEKFYKNNSDQILDITKKRIRSMALIHELTYKSDSLEKANVKTYFDIYDSEMKLLFDKDIEIDNQIDSNINLHIRTMTPLVLIINEFTSNSVKYAFNKKENAKNIISKKIYIKDDNYVIEYRDNGVGLPDGFNIHESTGLGWTIIKSLINQLNGNLEEIESEGVGFKITIPIVE